MAVKSEQEARLDARKRSCGRAAQAPNTAGTGRELNGRAGTSARRGRLCCCWAVVWLDFFGWTGGFAQVDS